MKLSEPSALKPGAGPREARRFPLAPDNLELCPPRREGSRSVRSIPKSTPYDPAQVGLFDAALRAVLEIGPLRYKVSGASSGRGWAIISLDIFRESL